MSQTLSPSLLVYGLGALRVCGRSRAPASIALSKRGNRTRSPVALVQSAPVRTQN